MNATAEQIWHKKSVRITKGISDCVRKMKVSVENDPHQTVQFEDGMDDRTTFKTLLVSLKSDAASNLA
jgi:hypothetical protein